MWTYFQNPGSEKKTQRVVAMAWSHSNDGPNQQNFSSEDPYLPMPAMTLQKRCKRGAILAHYVESRHFTNFQEIYISVLGFLKWNKKKVRDFGKANGERWPHLDKINCLEVYHKAKISYFSFRNGHLWFRINCFAMGTSFCWQTPISSLYILSEDSRQERCGRIVALISVDQCGRRSAAWELSSPDFN